MVERLVLALIMAAAVTSRADAQPAPAPPVEPPATAAIPLAPPSMVAPRDPATSPPAASSQWYGWQILIGDAAGFSFAAFSQNPSVAYGWVGRRRVVDPGH